MPHMMRTALQRHRASKTRTALHVPSTSYSTAHDGEGIAAQRPRIEAHNNNCDEMTRPRRCDRDDTITKL